MSDKHVNPSYILSLTKAANLNIVDKKMGLVDFGKQSFALYDWFTSFWLHLLLQHFTGDLPTHTLELLSPQQWRKRNLDPLGKHICIGVAKIEDVKNGQKVFRLKSFQVDRWVRIFAHLEHSFVDISTCQGHIRNLFAFS